MEMLSLLFLAAVGLVVTVPLAERLAIPYPVLLTLLGIAVAVIPSTHAVSVPPDLILPLLLPPLLWAAAFRTSWGDLRAYRFSISLLAIALVIVTAAIAGWLLTVLIPGLPWPVGFALGAALAPPDPVAASAVAGRIGLPHRMVIVIEGEGLVNDATSLTLYHTGLAAASVGGAIAWAGAGKELVIATTVGVLVGMAVAWIARYIVAQISDPIVVSAFTTILPFAAYLGAEAIGASGVIAVIVAALGMGRTMWKVSDPASRLIGRAFWETADLVLTGIAFVLIGLELRVVINTEGLDWHDTRIAAVVCLALIGVRMAWLLITGIAARNRKRFVPRGWREGIVMGWAGMRGVVTVAAALALPADIPHRNTLILIAFVVVFGTLILPGLTLPELARLLSMGTSDPEAHEREIAARLGHVMQTRLNEMTAAGEIDEREHDALERVCSGVQMHIAPVAVAAKNPERAAHKRHMRDASRVLLESAQEEALRLRMDVGVDTRAVDSALRHIDRRLLDLG